MADKNKKAYTLVCTSDNREIECSKQSNKQKSIDKKKVDGIKNEIMGEFSRYGTRVQY